MKDYDSQEELSDSEDPDLLSELQDLDVDVGSTSHRQVRSVLRSWSFFWPAPALRNPSGAESLGNLVIVI